MLALGGDGNYIRASHSVINEMPLIGINTDPDRSSGYLNFSKFAIDSTQQSESQAALDRISQFLESASDDDFGFRNRLKVVHIHKNYNEDSFDIIGDHICLNEVLLEEDIGSRTAIYDMKVGQSDLGRVKSSGLIVSTGTGSTGILLSALRPRMS